jgi:hypothetical protein
LIILLLLAVVAGITVPLKKLEAVVGAGYFLELHFLLLREFLTPLRWVLGVEMAEVVLVHHLEY